MSDTEGAEPEARTVPAAEPADAPRKTHRAEPVAHVSVDPSNWVPRNKYSEAKKRIEALEAQVASFATERAAWDADRALMGAGLLDEQARVVATALYGTLPEAERPSLTDWLGGLKSDPEQAPMALRPYLGAQQAEPPKASATTQARDTRQQTTSAPAGAQASLEAIRAAKEHGKRTGDWSRFRELSSLVAQDSGTR